MWVKVHTQNALRPIGRPQNPWPDQCLGSGNAAQHAIQTNAAGAGDGLAGIVDCYVSGFPPAS